MKATIIDAEKHLHWTDVPEITFADDEVLVEVFAAAMNRADLLQRAGKYPSPKGCPEWMGLEIAGKIAKIGAVAQANSNWKVGDRVCALLGGGGYAEFAAVRYDMLMPVPDNLTLYEAAAIPEVYTTSYLNLFIEGHLQKGQTVYIAAGASGIASAAIPMAKAYGCTVVTSVLSDEIAEKIKPLGADYIVNTSKERLADTFKRLDEEGHPVNVAIDCLAGDMLGESLSYMAEGGYWVLISTLAGVTTEVSLRPVLTRGLHLVGSMLRKRSKDEKAALLASLVKDIFPFFKDGSLKPSIYKILPIQKAEEAHEIMQNGENIGKIVLKVREDIANKGSRAGYRQVEAAEAKRIMDTEKDYIILDVRTEEEYEEGHVPNSVLLPHYEIIERAEKELPRKDQLILVICRRGHRSKTASEILVYLGYTNVVEFGGINEWTYEIEK